MKKGDIKSPPSHNPFASEGFKLSTFTHKCCCVAVRVGKKTVDIRDTKNPNGPTISFNKKEWAAFIKGVKNNEFNV